MLILFPIEGKGVTANIQVNSRFEERKAKSQRERRKAKRELAS